MSDENTLQVRPELLNTSDTSPTVGRLKAHIFSCFLNVKVKKSYLVIRLGGIRLEEEKTDKEKREFMYLLDQQFQSSISEDGQWNESFAFTVTFHAQLFGTIQIDLYESFAIYPDKHIGRAEIRLNTLEKMPETFSSYYEIWEKKLSTGASSSIGRERAAVNNRGALQIEIAYRYLRPSHLPLKGERLGKIKPLELHTPQSLVLEEQTAIESKRHLQFQKERRKVLKGEANVVSSQAPDQEGLVDDSEEEHLELLTRPLSLDATDHHSVQSDDEFGEMVAAPQPETVDPPSSWLSYKTATKKEIDQDWAGASDTSSVIKAIGKLLAIFGQGFELTHMQVLTGFTVLDRFYADRPRNRSWDVVEDLSEIDMGARFWKFSIASYGWKGLNFIGKGNGILQDAMREHSDAKSIVEYLMIPKEDLLAYEFQSAEAFRPSYFIVRDRFTNSIVLSIRGTMSVMDTLTDLVCEYEPWRGGFVHSGMKNSAIWFFQHVVPHLVAYTKEYATTGLTIVGHSLGAATAAILTIILTDYLDEFKEGEEEFDLKCYGYAPACGLSIDLAEQYKDKIQSYVFADDIVSKLSYGSMMDVKELIIASAEAVRNMGLGEILWANDFEGDTWKAAFQQITEVRKRCFDIMENPRLYVAGQIYQFWLDPTPSNDTRIVVEKAITSRVCDEIVVRKSILLDHLPTNFDVAFKRARETLMLEGTSSAGVLNPTPLEPTAPLDLEAKEVQQNVEREQKDLVWNSIAKLRSHQKGQ
ncbi:Sn1-specific diacylglycerol lipase alpha [Choanephora cucurbitarum]|uniref:sn-1-specific diacylglycerol lipase n=1 Tax=Choanephora cucurbitarum TaxID=101091 RepID=A0A1C7NJ39_9FUNG|nr:Sn1-specific diacylglycerol lipase alpha [Choanephora cucurbitarum]